ncbi:MAG: hypothetical protein KA712_06900 [Myxococcales bacterium]|nr:hypothetical protein [Myxococcales bacterium]
MTLRHIKPRTPDWEDAVEEGTSTGAQVLTPDEMYKLRQMVAMEQVLMGMPSPWAARNAH